MTGDKSFCKFAVIRQPSIDGQYGVGKVLPRSNVPSVLVLFHRLQRFGIQRFGNEPQVRDV